MPRFDVDGFRGIDTRTGQYAESLPAFVSAVNLDVRSGGVVARRPAMRKLYDLHAESVGLYARGGYLRAVVPGGRGYQALAPSGIIYDGIGNTGAFVASITISNGGSSYETAPEVTIAGGNPDEPAEAEAVVVGGVVTAINLLSAGAGYRSTPTVVISGGGGSGAAASAVLTSAGAYATGALSRLLSADTYGGSALFGAYAYVVVQLANGQVEHHWIKDPPADASTPIASRITLPFQPTGPALKLENKVWTFDGFNVRFSSSEFGPDNWTETGDAGFLPVSNHIAGNRVLVGLSHHRGRMAVLFGDAIQLWNVDEDPNVHEIEAVLNGPGALLPGSCVNVMGDLVYLSRGGFRNLATVSLTGESNESEQLGTPIASLTRAITGATPATALWSQSRSQYLCAVGTTVYVLTFLPGERLIAWTTWELPVAVEHLVEQDGVLYARAGDTLYDFTDDLDADFDGNPVAWSLETRPWTLGGAPNRYKDLRWLVYRALGASTWTPIVDGTALNPRRLPSSPNAPRRVPLQGLARQVAFRITGTAAFRLDGLGVEFELAGR